MNAKEICAGEDVIDGVTVLLCPNPNCKDSGGYPVDDGYGGCEEEQCQFCWTVENSMFNYTRKKTTKGKEQIMSDMSDDILEGVFCQECGAYIGDEVGYPRSCEDCKPAESER